MIPNSLGPAIVGGIGLLMGILAPVVWREDKKAIFVYRVYCLIVFILYVIVWAVNSICNQ